MSGAHLPDDPAAWPANPFALLGVPPGADPRAVRKAYHGLIRRFKPEHAPEAFRRIREAYEAVQRFAALFPRPADPAEVAPVEPPPPAPPVAAPAPPVEPPPPAVDPWERACAGEVEAAHRGLADRVGRGPRGEEAYLQLYWLLAITPGLDPASEPVAWLARGLRACGPARRLREAWDRQVEADPAAAWHPESARLLDPGTPAGVAAFVAEGRWRAARRLGRWEVVGADVGRLRGWLAGAAADAWARLLLLAAENAAWASGAARCDRVAYRAEAERVAYDHALDVDAELTRFEYAEALTDGLLHGGWAGIVDDGLADLLLRSWDDRGPGARAGLVGFAARLMRAPRSGLARLDAIHRIAPAILGFLVELLGEGGDDTLDEPTAFATLSYLATTRWGDYPKFRPHLLDFCLRERVSPLVVAGTIEGRPGYVLPGNLPLGLAIRSDWPLRAACRSAEVGRE